jgi:hypothetical protein
MPSAPAWHEAKVERLRAMVKAGKSASEIAEELNTSRNAVLGKLDRLGILLGGGKRHHATPRRHLVTPMPRNSVSVSQRPVVFRPTPPRRFTWQEPVDTTPQPA